VCVPFVALHRRRAAWTLVALAGMTPTRCIPADVRALVISSPLAPLTAYGPMVTLNVPPASACPSTSTPYHGVTTPTEQPAGAPGVGAYPSVQKQKDWIDPACTDARTLV
jgi:hypothetical protein